MNVKMTATNTSNTSSSYTLARVNVAAYICNAAVIFSVGSGLVPALLGYPGRDNASISHKYQTLVTPTDPAFGIWGFIYTAQLAWSLLLLTRSHQDQVRLGNTGATFKDTDSSRSNKPHDRILQAVGYNYLDACVGQMAWTVLFAAEQMTLALFAMLSIMLSLFRAVQAMRSVNFLDDSSDDSNNNKKNYWLYKFPLTLHFGWILAATGLNINAALVSWNLSGTTLFHAAMATLSLILFQALYMTWTDFDWIVPMTIIYTLAGIYVELLSPKHSIQATFDHRQVDTIMWTSKMGASLLVATLLARVSLMRLQQRQTTEAASHSTTSEETEYLRAEDK